MRKKVIIVGAGAAGLVAAHDLCKNKNLDITVLEKSSRPGGRIFTLETSEGNFEAGALVVLRNYFDLIRVLKEVGVYHLLGKFRFGNIFTELPDGSFVERANYPRGKRAQLKRIKCALKSWKYLSLSPLNKKGPDNTLTPFEFLTERGVDPAFFNKIDCVLGAYFYPDTKKSRMFGYGSPMIPWLLGINLLWRAREYSGNGSKIMEAISNSLKEKGVEFIYDTEVTSIKDGVKTSDGKSYEADAILWCGYGDSEVLKEMDIDLIPEYTSVTVTFLSSDAPALFEDKKDWKFIYYDKTRKPYIVSMENLLVKDKNIYSCYLTGDSLAEEALFEELSRLFPDNTFKIIGSKHWKKTLPQVERDIYEVRKKLEQKNIFFAGDFAGFPCVGSASAAGARAAKEIRKFLK